MSSLSPLPATTRRLKRIAPLQLGKILAILYGIMGFVVGPPMLMALWMSPPGPQKQPAIISAGVLAFFLPFLYAGLGFVFGALGAVCYNFVAQRVGGIEVEVE